MKKGWEMKRLGDVGKVIYGYTEKASYDAIGPKFLRITDIQEGGVDWDTVPYCKISSSDFSKYRLKSGDIVFARTGATTGKSYLLKNPPESVFASYLIKVHIDTPKLLSDYLYNFFQTQTYWDKIAAGVSGSAQGGFNASKLAELQIPVPPISEQQQIVAILDEAFAAIEQAKQNVQRNLQNAKDLFQSELNNIFTKKGEGWVEKKLGEVCRLINGRAYNQSELLDKGKYTVLRVGNFFTNNHWYFSDLELDEDKYCDNGDLLYAWSASFGPRIWKGGKVIYHYHIWKVQPFEGLIIKELLFYLLEWDTKNLKSAHGTGTTMIHVSKGSMDNRIVPVPTITEQQSIVQKLDTLFVETKKLEALYQQKLQELEDLKKSILQKAFSGKLTTEKAANLAIA